MAWATVEAFGLNHWVDPAAYYRAACGVDMIRPSYEPNDKPKCGVCVDKRKTKPNRK